MEVEILSRKLIKPSVPTPRHLQNLKISFLDQIAPLEFVPLLFYYPNINNEGIVKIRDLLEKSLSDVLTYYYPLAGRFVENDLLVDCSDQGVDYVEARVSGRVDELINRGKNSEMELLNILIPTTCEALETTPLVAIQVNIFDCGGLVIVVSVSHKLADGTTGAAFINAWATASRGGISQIRQPSFELGSLIPARTSLPQDDSVGISGILITKRFLFDSTSITALKAKAMSPHLKRPPTRMEVVSAVIWRAFLVAAKAKYGRLRSSVLVHSVSLRGKTVPPVSDTSCGNFYALSVARFEPDESKMELHDLVHFIRNSVTKTIDNCSKNLDGDEFFTAVLNTFKEVRGEVSEREEKDVHMFSSLLRLPFYEVDFGWGKPSWISGKAMNTEMVSLRETVGGNGLEAWVILNKPTMLCFEQDKDILAFTTSKARSIDAE